MKEVLQVNMEKILSSDILEKEKLKEKLYLNESTSRRKY